MIEIRGIFELIKNKIIYFYIKIFESLIIEEGVCFKNRPYIIKHKNAYIKIGKNTIINSSNYGYHINMHSKCKLYADKTEAQIVIGENCRIHGTCLHSYNQIFIGNNCLIAANTQIMDANGHLLSFESPKDRIKTKDIGNPIHIEDNVWIGANCLILGGTIIGEGSVITAGSVVKGKVPPRCIYGGNPAQLLKQY